MLEFLSRKQQLKWKQKAACKTSVDLDDAHAIDTKYHKQCQATFVANVLRRVSYPANKLDIAGEVADEFPSFVEITVLNGNSLDLSQLQDAYMDILLANTIRELYCNCEKQKQNKTNCR